MSLHPGLLSVLDKLRPGPRKGRSLTGHPSRAREEWSHRRREAGTLWLWVISEPAFSGFLLRRPIIFLPWANSPKLYKGSPMAMTQKKPSWTSKAAVIWMWLSPWLVYELLPLDQDHSSCNFQSPAPWLVDGRRWMKWTLTLAAISAVFLMCKATLYVNDLTLAITQRGWSSPSYRWRNKGSVRPYWLKVVMAALTLEPNPSSSKCF